METPESLFLPKVFVEDEILPTGITTSPRFGGDIEYVRKDRIRELETLAKTLVSAVEQYVEPKPGTKYLSRAALLNIKNNLKTLLTK